LPGDQQSRPSFNWGNEAMSDFMQKMVALANVVHGDLVALPNNRARYDLVKPIIDRRNGVRRLNR
jgi:hypothetical protein